MCRGRAMTTRKRKGAGRGFLTPGEDSGGGATTAVVVGGRLDIVGMPLPMGVSLLPTPTRLSKQHKSRHVAKQHATAQQGNETCVVVSRGPT